LYLPEVVSRSVLDMPQYRGRAVPRRTNPEDFLYRSMGGDASTLNVHRIGRDSNEDGFFGQMTIGIDTFAVSSQIKPEDFDKYTVYAAQRNSVSASINTSISAAVVVSPVVMRMHGPQAAPLRTTVNRL
jgi:hypothetical protein